MKDTARIITTFKCSRNCSYCANKSRHIKNAGKISLSNLQKLTKFDYICITGGEPMEYVDETLHFIKELKKIKDFTIYLYTARYSPRVKEVISLVDGIHYTLHKNSNWEAISDFYIFQTLIKKYKKKSFRLYLHNEIKFRIAIQPSLWRRIEAKPFKVECELPEREKLFILEK